jgi:hypothetical protein
MQTPFDEGDLRLPKVELSSLTKLLSKFASCGVMWHQTWLNDRKRFIQ